MSALPAGLFPVDMMVEVTMESTLKNKLNINTLKEHQLVLTIAIFQRILITMDVYEISIFCPQNPMKDTIQFREDLKEIYIEKFTNIGRSKLR